MRVPMLLTTTSSTASSTATGSASRSDRRQVRACRRRSAGGTRLWMNRHEVGADGHCRRRCAADRLEANGVGGGYPGIRSHAGAQVRPADEPPHYLATLGIVPAMKGEALRGQLDVLVLATLRDEPAHGYAVIRRLDDRSAGAFALAEGTVYPVLHRLEAEGLLASEWSAVAGRRRRVYRLSRAGRSALEQREREWRTFATAVEAVLA